MHKFTVVLEINQKPVCDDHLGAWCWHVGWSSGWPPLLLAGLLFALGAIADLLADPEIAKDAESAAQAASL